MSITLGLFSLRLLAGVVGVGYSLYSNRISDEKIDPATIGNFNFGKIPDAIFGETIGGFFADWLREGTDKGYQKFLKSIKQFDKDGLNHDLQRAAKKAQLLATFFACQSCLANIKADRTSIWHKIRDTFQNEDIAWLTAVSKDLQTELKNIETVSFESEIQYKELFAIFDKDKIINSQTSADEFSKKLKEEVLFEIENTYRSKVFGHIGIEFSSRGFELLKDAIEKGWDEFPQDKDFIIQLNLKSDPRKSKKKKPQEKQYDWFDLICILFNEEYKTNDQVQAALQKRELLEIKSLLLNRASTGLDSLGNLEIKIDDLIKKVIGLQDVNSSSKCNFEM